MKLAILIDIEPASATECGACPRGRNTGGCSAFGESRFGEQRAVRSIGRGGRPALRYRLAACIDAERRAKERA